MPHPSSTHADHQASPTHHKMDTPTMAGMIPTLEKAAAAEAKAQPPQAPSMANAQETQGANVQETQPEKQASKDKLSCSICGSAEAATGAQGQKTTNRGAPIYEAGSCENCKPFDNHRVCKVWCRDASAQASTSIPTSRGRAPPSPPHPPRPPVARIAGTRRTSARGQAMSAATSAGRPPASPAVSNSSGVTRANKSTTSPAPS